MPGLSCCLQIGKAKFDPTSVPEQDSAEKKEETTTDATTRDDSSPSTVDVNNNTVKPEGGVTGEKSSGVTDSSGEKFCTPLSGCVEPYRSQSFGANTQSSTTNGNSTLSDRSETFSHFIGFNWRLGSILLHGDEKGCKGISLGFQERETKETRVLEAVKTDMSVGSCKPKDLKELKVQEDDYIVRISGKSSNTVNTTATTKKGLGPNNNKQSSTVTISYLKFETKKGETVEIGNPESDGETFEITHSLSLEKELGVNEQDQRLVGLFGSFDEDLHSIGGFYVAAGDRTTRVTVLEGGLSMGESEAETCNETCKNPGEAGAEELLEAEFKKEDVVHQGEEGTQV